ncbi:acetate-CoA ligase [Staphylococcus saprophyticus]|uniref:Acetate-CoA ligase n=1 Tax=Staphylococcus saprophyticus TaxID=29385 RepID=A0A380HHD7_STASA|nr:acetate-CoA ligase [Staphylococcus saprophyticus]
MDKKDLIAPEQYNIVSEIEKFATDAMKKAVIFEDASGETKEITYKQLIKHANKVGNMFFKTWTTKRRQSLSDDAALH